MNLEYLKSVNIEVPQEVVKEQVNKTPEGMTIRVFSNGGIYPSKELVSVLGLEYTHSTSEHPGYGLDIFLSSDWGGFPKDAPETYLFISAVKRDQPKIDVFTRTSYKDDGSPLKSVLDQGGGTFGKTLVKLIEQAYGITIPVGGYQDMEVNTSIVMPSPTGAHYVPKMVTRGENKGKMEAVRRDGAVISPLTPIITSDENVVESPVINDRAVQIEDGDGGSMPKPDSEEVPAPPMPLKIDLNTETVL